MALARNVSFSVAVALLSTGGGLLAQEVGFTDYCVVFYRGENHSRTIGASSSIRAECGGDGHSAPFGNWGVTSNYGHAVDSNQFPGWKVGTAWRSGETIWQWNSCTGPPESRYGRGRISYYNGSSGGPHSPWDYQYSTIGMVPHGYRIYRKPIPCEGSRAEPLPSATGCERAFYSYTQAVNFMSLYELDVKHYSLITTLYFPGITVDMNCDFYGCSERVSDWKDVSTKTNYASHVNAQIRMRVSAGYESGCGWD